MSFRNVLACCAAVAVLLSCAQATGDVDGTDAIVANARDLGSADIAAAWAPILYQDVDATGDHALGGKADFITSVNFDGDWSGTNNWNNAGSSPLAAAAYYSVVETSTHWYLLYGYYHPRDWTDNPFAYYFDEHENDMEGCLLVVYKDGTTYGQLQAMVTTFHSDFFSYVPSGSPFQANTESIDGTVTLETYNGTQHPQIAQECRGHGLKARPYVNINGDGIIYKPSLVNSEVPASLFDTDAQYRLNDIFASGGLWDQRTNTALFNSDQGSFVKSYGYGGANAPWQWNDGDDTPAGGEQATDPSHLTSEYFKNLGTFSTVYTKNPYTGVQ